MLTVFGAIPGGGTVNRGHPTSAEQAPYEAGYPLPRPVVRNDATLPPGGGHAAIPHYISFNSIVNLASRTYRWQFDEALRHNFRNAFAMRRDPIIMEALRARQIPTAQLSWQIEGPDDENPYQQEAIAGITDIISNMPHWQRFLMHLLEGIWYGKAGVQIAYEWDYSTGKKLMVPRQFWPLNGDKIAVRFSGQVGVYVHTTFDGDWNVTDRARAHFLTPEEREQFVIWNYEPEDSDFFEAELAGQVAGVGVRSRVYWFWFLKSRVEEYLMDYLARVGAGGTWIGWYQEANNDQRSQMEADFKEQAHDNVWLLPRSRQAKDMGAPEIQHIPASNAGAQMLLELTTNYFGSRIRSYVLASSSHQQASKADSLSAGAADLKEDSFARVIKYDAISLGEAITHDFVEVLRRWNYPMSPKLKFKFDVDSPNTAEVMEAAGFFYDMGGTLNEENLRDNLGLATPEEGKPVLSKMDSLSPMAPGMMPQGIPMEGMPGPMPMVPPEMAGAQPVAMPQGGMLPMSRNNRWRKFRVRRKGVR